MDIVTQVQEEADKLATLLFTSIGVLQRDAPPASVNGEPCCQANEASTAAAADANEPHEPQPDTETIAKDMAATIVRTAKGIDTLIENLPGVGHSSSDQLRRLTDLDKENREYAEHLRAAVQRAEVLLAKVQEGLRIIAEDHVLDVERAARMQ
eukprot:TRINITY_DN26110_c0_g1_i1.p1 TRINITY_DN26110_c0_g1~~TRINITY_DN26110_c0_g1_i1.p1  ORF type:complete len:153 (-),score=31.00 TRINITY_DN26110_c0_g1_i1:30-488(-)